MERRHAFDPRGPACAIEYPLPCTAMPKNVRQRLDPWLAGRVGHGPEDARVRLKARWSDLRGLGLGPLTGFFLRCTPHSVLVNAQEAWLIVRGRPDNDFKSGREWFLPPPTTVGDVDRALDRFQIGKNPVLKRSFVNSRDFGKSCLACPGSSCAWKTGPPLLPMRTSSAGKCRSLPKTGRTRS